MMQWHANGKLLLSGEYAVLDGALALALPARLGQRMRVSAGAKIAGEAYWESRDADGQVWFRGQFALENWTYLAGTDASVGKRLETIGQAVLELHPDWLKGFRSLRVVTDLEFPREWGLGTSSTLLTLIGAWAGVSPYALLEASFGGSGYDIACAQADGPVFFQRNNGHPGFVRIPFRPAFLNQLYFVYLGKKQDSREGIARYRAIAAGKEAFLSEISTLSWEIAQATDLASFERLVEAHERCVSEALQLPRVKDVLFPDFWGSVKSLGAWGGDFVLVTSMKSEEETKKYFAEKGLIHALPYRQLIR